MDKNKGSMVIELRGTGATKYEPFLQNALQVLQQRSISVSVDKKPQGGGCYIVIDVKDIGMIDREDMTEFLNTLVSKEFEKLTFVDNVTVTLRHDQKVFALPDEMDECVDWFHRE